MRDGIIHATSPLMVGLAQSGSRFLSFTVNSSGVAVLVGDTVEDAVIVYAGTGKAKVKALVDGGVLWVKPLGKEMICSIDIPEIRKDEAGWHNEPSLTDLAPRPFGAISPEIRAVIDQMNRNAIIREQAMLRALGSR